MKMPALICLQAVHEGLERERGIQGFNQTLGTDQKLIRKLGAYSQHFIFFATYESVQ